jgi:hypothetical protein
MKSGLPVDMDVLGDDKNSIDSTVLTVKADEHDIYSDH